jgi:hypothetical protein
VANGIVIVPGRNLLLCANAGRWTGTRFGNDDVTLRGRTIKSQTDEALAVFGLSASSANPARRTAPVGKRAFINPFTNNPRKCLPRAVMDTFLLAWRALFGADAAVMLNMGTCGDRVDPGWVRSLGGGMDGRDIFHPRSLAEVAHAMSESALVLSCDSGPAYVAERLGVPGITVYNATRWDPFSPWSLSHHSPLGFSPASAHQIPLASHWLRSKAARDPGLEAMKACISALVEGPSQSLRQAARTQLDHMARCASSAGTGHWLERWWPHHEMRAGLQHVTAAQDTLLQAILSASPAAKLCA